MSNLNQLIPGLDKLSKEDQEKAKRIVEYSNKILLVFPIDLDIEYAVLACLESAARLMKAGIAHNKKLTLNEISNSEALNELIQMLEDIKAIELSQNV